MVLLHNKQNSKWMSGSPFPLKFTAFWMLLECHLLAVKGTYFLLSDLRE